MPLALQTLNGVGFTIRQHAGNHFINAGFFGDGIRGSGVIPGEHHQAVALTMQARQGVDAVFAQRVTDGEQRGRLTIHRQQHRRSAARGLRHHLAFYIAGGDMLLVEQRLVAEQQAMTFRLTADAKAAQGAEAAHFRQRAVSGFIEDRSRQRMA